MLNIFDLQGPDFLAFYVTLMAIAVITGAFLRWSTRLPVELPDRLPILTPFEIAYLAGGPKRAIDTAIAALVRRGSLTVSTFVKHLDRAEPLEAGANSLEQRIYAICGTLSSIASVRRAALPFASDTNERLQRSGLTLDSQARLFPYVLPISIIIGVLAIGLIKVAVGISRDRPVGFLGMLCFITLSIAVGFGQPVWRTRRADELLRKLRDANAALQSTATRQSDLLGQDDFLLAFALFGPAVLQNATGAVRELLPVLAAGNGGSSSGCGSGGSCGGGGGGCGGGGCGGCGS